MRPAGVVVSPEIERLPRDDLTRCDVVNFVGQRQDETAHAVDPCHQYLVRPEFPPQVEVATVAIVQIQVLGLQLVHVALRRGTVDQLIEASAGKALA